MATIVRRRKLGMSSVKGICQFSKMGIGWVRSDRPLPEDELYIRWGCTADVPTKKVLNNAGAIHLVNDKADFRGILNEHSLCPETWFSVEEVPDDALIDGVIVRKRNHSQGRGVHLCLDREGLSQVCSSLGDRNFYISRYIRKVAEYRVFVVQGRAVCVAKKTPANANAIAWNVAQGGRFDNVRWDDWPLKAVKVSIQGFLLSGLDFGGVDVMVDEDGACYILEINSAPSLTSPYRQQCMAKAFDYILQNGKEVIPLKKERGNYRKFIHPAIIEPIKQELNKFQLEDLIKLKIASDKANIKVGE